ncbi:peptidase C39, bacteriocin processing [Rhodopirellula maiorica SM1]|uniref:Peptidase C39, bacteriocin processing n=1 Tax=Rhodopirellula maiorica SM1 TaxID=1265738 RepID=M5RC68_9BACT|nr:peptidase C39, bacteriocin processing [Rhodopirellula maiorica]EMI17083.1 peptidase C39, bacteriocin processing [Rhodopirellula maiorica SM1]
MDLIIALLITTSMTVIIIVLVAWWLRPKPRDASNTAVSNLASIVLAFAVLASFLLLYATKDRMGWATLLPFSSAIIFSNWTAFALAVASGAAYRLPHRPLWRRGLAASLMAALALATLVQPVLQPIFRPVTGSNMWDSKQVCIQSHTNTCSAAAAATLLKSVGIEKTEAAMVGHCLTDARGTPSLGLWRGLSLATTSTRYRPKVLHTDVETLLRRGPWPAALVVGLPRYGADPIYVHRYGWDPGFRHSIVLFGRNDDGMLDIGDPSIGRETWSDDDLRVLWRGEGVTLVRR